MYRTTPNVRPVTCEPLLLLSPPRRCLNNPARQVLSVSLTVELTSVNHAVCLAFRPRSVVLRHHQAVPAAQKTSWTTFLKSCVPVPAALRLLSFALSRLASFAGDLSSLTAPPFILSPTSLTEFPGTKHSLSIACLLISSPAYWCERPELFARIVDGETEEERAYAVLKWFIVALPSFIASLR